MKKNKILVCSLILALVLLNACKSTQKMSFNIVNLKEARGIRHYSTLYALPKTVIRVNLKVVKTSYKRGPYYQYANSFLGIEDVIEEDKEGWRITDVKFETYAIADTNHIYLIETNDELSKIEIKLSDCGLLEQINPRTDLNREKEIKEYKSVKGIGEVGLKSHKLADTDEFNFDDVPLPKDVLLKRSVREQASQLAGKILSLREDRSAILVGDGYTENMPAGEALNIMIDKIDKIHSQYVSLFKGKIRKESFQYTFDYIPEDARKITQAILFRFSEEHGIVENTDMSGKPMIIEIESYQNLKYFEEFKRNQVFLKRAAKEKETDHGLYYRIPEMGIVRLLANDDVLMQEKINVSQFGSIHSLPAKYLDGNYNIELHPELGSLKSIKKVEHNKSGTNK